MYLQRVQNSTLSQFDDIKAYIGIKIINSFES